MQARLIVLLLFSIFSFSNAQTFVGQPVQSSSKKLLDQLFNDYEVVSLDVNEIQNALNTRSTVKNIQISTSRYQWDLVLFEYDLFRKDYFLTAAGDQGNSKLGRNRSIRTFKANPKSPRGGLSCMTVADNFLYGYIEEAGVKYFYEPVYGLDPSAPKNELVIYSENSVRPDASRKCGYDDFKSHLHIGEQTEEHQPNGLRSACYSVDIALACDKTIHDNKGGVAQSEAFVTGVLNNVQTNYDNEFAHAIEFSIATIFVATTTQSDPWNGVNNINTHLDIHRSWANGGGYGTGYAVATAWTRKYTSGAIGLAWVGSVCTGFRYNVCSDFGGGAQSLRVLQAHELGHNFNCGHDNAGSNTIMAPSVNNSNTWSSASIAAVNAFVPTRGCLGGCSSGIPPEANFTAIPTFVCAVGVVNFTDLSANTPTAWLWTFPGGSPSTSTTQNPRVTYSTRGTYDVTLRASNSFGSNTVTFNSYIEVEQKPVVSFNVFTTLNEIQCENFSSFADSYLWKFGDGNTSNEDNPTHIYQDDGVYNVELIATNRCGSTSKTFRVTIVTPVSADFTSDIQRGCAEFKVKYKNLSSKNSTAFEWEFPGGTPSKSNLKEPVVTYSNKGVFDVSLKASNSRYSEVRKVSKYITADSIPVSDFTRDSAVGNLVKFFSKSVDADSVLWNFGDGKTSKELEPEHIFPGPGKYNVCLIAQGKCGKDTLCQDVEIANKLNAVFTVSPANGCAPFTVKFKNGSTGAAKYLWKFPGGIPSESTEAEPEVVYNDRGVYDVTLAAISGSDTSNLLRSGYIEVGSMPEPDYQSSVTGLTVFFNNVSKYGSTYAWDFGDGENSTEQSPSHTYKAEGDYKVVLKVTNECGTVESVRDLTVLLIPRVDFTAKTQICAGDKLNFRDLSSKDVIDWSWQFESANPPVSTDKNPTVLFPVAGVYTVKLKVKNTNGENSVTKVGYINVLSNVLCPDKSGKKPKAYPYPDKDDLGNELDARGEQGDSEFELLVSPNPSEGIFSLQVLGELSDKQAVLKLMDLSGKLILENRSSSAAFKNIKLDLTHLSPGVYMLSLNDGLRYKNTRLVITR